MEYFEKKEKINDRIKKILSDNEFHDIYIIARNKEEYDSFLSKTKLLYKAKHIGTEKEVYSTDFKNSLIVLIGEFYEMIKDSEQFNITIEKWFYDGYNNVVIEENGIKVTQGEV